MGKLRDKYSGHSIAKYRVSGEGEGRRLSGRRCELCGVDVREAVDSGAEEVMCHRCLMGLADAYDPEKAFTQKELVGAIRDRGLEQFRVKYGLSQGFLSRYLGISVRQYQRYEKGKYISIDSLVKAIARNGSDVVSA